ncbi:hypothetical protein DFR78_1193 [Halanaerobium sp. MA284_MarDTE_T2]|nr:hypothetical protein DFR78_1193 [Halanaerobium sp. MA284_MarDTE_T2]RCW78361.1 hypothetical protein DER71_1568 [Halanaerobium sp. DL-01]
MYLYQYIIPHYESDAENSRIDYLEIKKSAYLL